MRNPRFFLNWFNNHIITNGVCSLFVIIITHFPPYFKALRQKLGGNAVVGVSSVVQNDKFTFSQHFIPVFEKLSVATNLSTFCPRRKWQRRA